MPRRQMPKKFDPEGVGYDYDSAVAGMEVPDAKGHWPSFRGSDGMMLKGRKHPTYGKTVQSEGALGNEIVKGADGRYYSKPRLR